jgi:hypothetical protein
MAAFFEHRQNFKQALEIRAHRFVGVGIGLERVDLRTDSRTDRFDQKLDIRHELDYLLCAVCAARLQHDVIHRRTAVARADGGDD